MTRLDRTRVAYHEAGHATVGRLLDIGVEQATIIPAGSALGHVKHDGMRHYGELGCQSDSGPIQQVTFERAAMLSLAGCMAERRYLGASADDLEGYEGALEDLQNATASVKSLVGDNDEVLVEAWLHLLDLRVDRLLDRHWGAVELVASHLLERETLSGAEIDQCIVQGAVRAPSRS